MEQMDCKPYQPLSKVKHEVDLTYTSSSDESEDGGKQRQSYDSRETLNEYSQELRLNYNSHSRKRKAIDQSTQGKALIFSANYGCYFLIVHYEIISGVEQTFCFQRLVVPTHFVPGFKHIMIPEI